uniref:Chromatin assembly factor 1 subunit A dimerization domain-containing protein n=2 Tax=Caenorhabditis japonica TaxID=281687 RepID=A0A8R1EJB1_CAEJA
MINSLSEFLNSATKLEKPKQNDMKAKFYQFHENRRPPYYGTWRKKSTIIRGWTPFAEETGIDYEVDSDNEWEDEPSDCEECNSDDDADKDNEEDENEEDDGFFVPPCYLSDGEGEEDDNSDGEITTVKKAGSRVKIDSDDEDDNEKGQDDVSDEHRKARMAQRASEWSKRTEKKKALNIIPRAIGPVY